MILFERITLNNGLRVIVHTDKTTPFVAVNACYNVGAKHEDPERTGFAHLFEHLTFGGSLHVKDFDTPTQQAGGTNNAFTSNDITNYQIISSSNHHIILFASQPQRDAQLRYASAFDVFTAVKDNADVTLIIKLHPAELNDIKYYESIA